MNTMILLNLKVSIKNPFLRKRPEYYTCKRSEDEVNLKVILQNLTRQCMWRKLFYNTNHELKLEKNNKKM